MPRPKKAVSTIDNSISRKTKSELELRKAAEESLLSKEKIFERDTVKKNPQAHKEFLRLKKLLEKINKADALYGAVLNRYCEIHSEIIGYEERRAELNKTIDKLNEKFEEMDDVEYDDVYSFGKMLTQLITQVNKVDSLIMQKRKMMFDIEKENCMTVSSALRTIPREPTKAAENPLIALLSGDDEEDE